MSELAAVGLALTSLRTAYDMTKGFLGVRDAVISQGQIFELQRQILSAQEGALAASSAQSTLLEEISELKQQIAAMETWDAEKEDYELKAVHVTSFAYVAKPGVQKNEPPHWLCAACYQKRRKSILQGAGPSADRGEGHFSIKWECPNCSSIIRVPFQIYPQKLADQETKNASP